MLNKITKAAAIVAATLMAQQTMAATPEFASAVQEMGESAVKGYMQPFATGLGVGMNSQWAYSSKAQSFLGLPVGASIYIGYPVVLVNKDMKTFSFQGTLPAASLIEGLGLPAGMSIDSIASAVSLLTGGAKTYDSLGTLHINVEDVPTIYGSDKQKKITVATLLAGADLLNLVNDYDSLATALNPGLILAGQTPMTLIAPGLNDSVALPFRGFDLPIAPTLPPVGINLAFTSIPVLNNITIGARYVPTLVNDELGSIGMFGFTLQHEITQHIPVLGKAPFLHFGVLYGYNSFTLEAKDVVTIESKNQVGMVTASVDVKFLVGLGLYCGVGYEQSTLTVDVQSQTFAQNSGPDLVTPAFDVSIDGKNVMRSQVGARFSFAAFDLYTDINFGSTTTYNAGLAIGLNGL